jgi:hypothetical protein
MVQLVLHKYLAGVRASKPVHFSHAFTAALSALLHNIKLCATAPL